MTTGEREQPSSTEVETCSQCGREIAYCVCQWVTPVSTKTSLVILQHPQEPGVDIGTVPIVKSLFPNSIVKTGLSWPNLSKVLGREAIAQRWGVLYLGSVHVDNLPKDRELFVVDKKGEPLQNQAEALKGLEGIILLDGTWSQAKTLWWRNAWLLKLKRLVLRPTCKPIYDKIRREPRRGCLSTLETAGEVLRILELNEAIREGVQKPLEELVSRLASNKPRGAGPGPRSLRYRSRRKQGKAR